MKKLIVFSILALTASAAVAQLQVRQNGHVVIGDKTSSSQTTRLVGGYPFTPDSTLAMTVTGSGLYNTGGRIGFGNNGDVYIGELRNRDNVFGIRAPKGLVYHSSMDIFRYSEPSAGTSYPFEFLTMVSAPVFVTDSDVRLKSDIKQMDGLWKRLQDLTPVSYVLHAKASLTSVEEEEVSAPQEVKATAIEDTRRSYGLVAQEVREIFPELVYENEDGVLGLDYQGFIPILIEAVNSLSQTVAEQRQLISEQQTALMKMQGQQEKQISLQAFDVLASMDQNRPNPFSVSTDIKCQIPEDAVQAVLNIYDLRGKQLKSFPIERTGEVTVSVSADGLEDGMYLYALIVDGVEAESRRMIISR